MDHKKITEVTLVFHKYQSAFASTTIYNLNPEKKIAQPRNPPLLLMFVAAHVAVNVPLLIVDEDANIVDKKLHGFTLP